MCAVTITYACYIFSDIRVKVFGPIEDVSWCILHMVWGRFVIGSGGMSGTDTLMHCTFPLGFLSKLKLYAMLRTSKYCKMEDSVGRQKCNACGSTTPNDHCNGFAYRVIFT